MAKLESLVVDLQLETAELTRGLAEVKKQLKEAGDSVEGLLNFEVLKEVGKLAFEAAEKLADFALEGAEVADKMGKMAVVAGIPVEQFSRLAYAANLSKVSTEDFGVALKKLNVNISEAAAGGAKQASLFSALGVSVKDAAGKTRDADAVMGDLADRFSELQDGPEKAALAVALFGKAGSQMIPFLNEGREGLKKLGEEADRFGITISSSTVAAATEFNDNVERISKSVEGLSVQVAAQLAPAMADLTKQLLDSKTSAQGFRETAEVLATTLRIIVSVAVEVVGGLRKIGAGAAGLASIVANLAGGDLSGALEASRAFQEEIVHINDQTTAQVEAVWKKAEQVMTLPGLDLRESTAKIFKQFKDGESASKQMEEAIKKLTSTADEYIAKLDEVGKGTGTFERLSAEFEKGKLSEELKKAGIEGLLLRDVILETAKALDEAVNDAAKLKLDFGVQRQVTSNNVGFASQATAYSNIGATAGAVAGQDTAGFGSFSAALAVLAEQTNNQAKYLAEAQDDERQGHEKAAEQMFLFADRSKEAARVAGLAVAGFVEIAKEEKTALDKMSQAIGAAANHFISKLGDLGQVVQSAVQGFQQGGWWGAIVAVIVELFSRFKRFSEIQQNANDQLEALITQLGPALDTLTNGFEKLQNSLGKMMQTVGTALSPVLDEVGRILGLVGDLLGPIFTAIESAIGPVTEILHIFTGLASALDPLQFVIKLVSMLLTLVALAFLEMSNGIQTALAGVFRAIFDALLSITGPNDATKALYDIAVTFQQGALATQNKIKGIWAQLGDTADHFFDDGSTSKTNTNINTDVAGSAKTTVDSLDGLAKGTDKATTAIAKLTEQFTNLPSGFKVRLRTMQATNPTGADPDSLRNNSQIHIHAAGGITTTVNDLVTLIQQGLKKDQFRKKGF